MIRSLTITPQLRRGLEELLAGTLVNVRAHQLVDWMRTLIGQSGVLTIASSLRTMLTKILPLYALIISVLTLLSFVARSIDRDTVTFCFGITVVVGALLLYDFIMAFIKPFKVPVGNGGVVVLWGQLSNILTDAGTIYFPHLFGAVSMQHTVAIPRVRELSIENITSADSVVMKLQISVDGQVFDFPKLLEQDIAIPDEDEEGFTGHMQRLMDAIWSALKNTADRNPYDLFDRMDGAAFDPITRQHPLSASLFEEIDHQKGFSLITLTGPDGTEAPYIISYLIGFLIREVFVKVAIANSEEVLAARQLATIMKGRGEAAIALSVIQNDAYKRLTATEEWTDANGEVHQPGQFAGLGKEEIFDAIMIATDQYKNESIFKISGINTIAGLVGSLTEAVQNILNQRGRGRTRN